MCSYSYSGIPQTTQPKPQRLRTSRWTGSGIFREVGSTCSGMVLAVTANVRVERRAASWRVRSRTRGSALSHASPSAVVALLPNTTLPGQKIISVQPPRATEPQSLLSYGSVVSPRRESRGRPLRYGKHKCCALYYNVNDFRKTGRAFGSLYNRRISLGIGNNMDLCARDVTGLFLEERAKQASHITIHGKRRVPGQKSNE